MGATTSLNPTPDARRAVQIVADVAHAAHVAALEARAVGQIAAVRRAAEVALQAQETDLEAQAAGQVAAAVRAEQAEAARILVQTMKQHDVALARVRAEADADVSQAQHQLEELKQQVADRAEKAAVRIEGTVAPRAQVDVARSETHVTPSRLGLVEITGIVVLAGLTGTLIGWLVSLSVLL